MRRLFLDQNVFLSILDSPDAFGLDVDEAAVFLQQLEVGGVLCTALWHDVRDFVSLEHHRQASLSKLIGDLSLKAASITMLNAEVFYPA